MFMIIRKKFKTNSFETDHTVLNFCIQFLLLTNEREERNRCVEENVTDSQEGLFIIYHSFRFIWLAEQGCSLFKISARYS